MKIPPMGPQSFGTDDQTTDRQINMTNFSWHA